jgi:hypothetical protein
VTALYLSVRFCLCACFVLYVRRCENVKHQEHCACRFECVFDVIGVCVNRRHDDDNSVAEAVGASASFPINGVVAPTAGGYRYFRYAHKMYQL